MDLYDFAVHLKQLRDDREQEAKAQAIETLTNYRMIALAIHSDAQSYVNSLDKSIAQAEGAYHEEVGDLAGLTALKAEMEGNRWRKQAVSTIR